MIQRAAIFALAWACWPCALMLGWIVYAAI